MTTTLELAWRTSTHCHTGECVEVACTAGLVFIRSSSSMANGNCVEVARGRVIRDSKDPDGLHLHFTSAEWRQFTAAIRAGLLPGT